MSIIPIDSKIARLAGFVRRNYRLEVPDSIIAATTLFTGSKLIIRNTKHFKKVPNIELVEI